MKIRALSVFEGVVYHCWCVDPEHPCRPTLEVEALLRPADADAESGPLFLSVADYIPMAGGIDAAGPSLDQIGRASCRDRVCQSVEISVVAVSFKQKNNRTKRSNTE